MLTWISDSITNNYYSLNEPTQERNNMHIDQLLLVAG
jgi:hypothetical protein